jgi:glycosyltransferase involved in cell wall biosynthesis
MNQQLLVWLSEGALVFFLIAAFVVVLSANIYDIKLASRRKSIKKMQSTFRRMRKPAISVLVFAENSASSIKACLDSIRRNHYPNIDVVVVNNSSTDATRQTVRSIMEKYPKFPIRLYSKRSPGLRADALLQGYRRSQKGDCVLVIDASTTMGPTLLRDCVARFTYDNKLQAIHFNIKNPHSASVTLLSYQFLQLSKSLMNKFYSLFSKYRPSIHESGTIYRHSYFNTAGRSTVINGDYDSDLVISDSLVGDDKTAIAYQFNNTVGNMYYFLIAVIAILFQTYSMYMAATFQNKLLLTIGWLAMGLWLLIAIWSSRALKIRDKIKFSCCAPIVYFLVYVQLIVYLSSAVFKAIFSLTHSVTGYLRNATSWS